MDQQAAMESIYQAVAQVRGAELRALETACEKAIQGGRYGVMIDYRRGAAWVDERVSYGYIWDVSACGSENVIA